MKLSQVKLLPLFLPGDPEMGEVVCGLADKRSAVMLANYGLVAAGKDLEAAYAKCFFDDRDAGPGLPSNFAS